MLTDAQPGKYSMGEPKSYKVNLNLVSGLKRTYRGKLIEENVNANG